MRINHYDEYQIWDELQKKAVKENITCGPIGWVQMYMNKKLVLDDHNLVVAQGREFVAQKIFGIYAYSGGNRPNYTGYKISHFGIGGGGAVASGDTFELKGPAICDTGMYKPITLGNNAYYDDPSNYDAGTTSLFRAVDSIKPITGDGGSVLLESVSYPEGSSTPTCTFYTKAKCTCIIPAGEPSGLSSGSSIQISEAGLYFTSSSTVKMFSHICFSPKFLEKESELEIIWYILC